jgi:hypothetical protein
MLGLALLALGGALAPPAARAADADHLVITQVVPLSRAPYSTGGSEFVEITNPTGAAVDLSDVYLTSAELGPDLHYHNIVTGASIGGGTGGNFHCRFPDGASLAAGASLVIALAGSAQFQEAYGFLPDFELFEDALTPDAVPEMVPALPGRIGVSLGGSGQTIDLSHTNDSLVLYRWDGASDRVQDLDYVFWGTLTNLRVDKSLVSLDGPDAGTDPTPYLADTPVGSQNGIVVSGLTFGESLMRTAVQEGTETTTGGNGQTGHDETSENLAGNWSQVAAAPAGPPAAWLPPQPIFTSVTLALPTPYTGQPDPVTAVLVANDDVAAVSLFWRTDGGAFTEVAASEGAGGWTADIPAQASATTVQWYLVAEGSGGGVATYPAGAPVFPASVEVEVPPAPAFTGVVLSPAEPYADMPTTVTAGLETPDAVAAVALFWRADGGAWSEVAMTAAGASWSGQIPARDGGELVEWYLEAEGLGGDTTLYPAGAPGTVESFTVADEPPVAEGPVHLLMTEICVVGSAEFVEIVNPTAQPVDLSRYYLTDAIYSPDSQFYWRIVEPTLGPTNVGGGAFYDFHARFPDGARIAAGDTITVAVGGSSAFSGTFGALPTYEVYEDGAGPDDVPDLEPVWSTDADHNSIFSRNNANPSDDSVPTLTNTAEIVVLYYWNGESDLVTDVDVFRWGTSTSAVFSKTGVSIDGPDADATASSYLPETATGSQRPNTGTTGFAGAIPETYQRTPEVGEGSETASGSNGVGGHDEVSENWAATFVIAPATPAVPRGSGKLELAVPPRTFLPRLGETFPVRFTSLPGHQTWLRLFDLEGRLVLTLYDSRTDGEPSTIPGQYTRIDWDGRDEVFELVPAGMYIVHLQAVDRRTGDLKSMQAPVVVATRLSR